MSLTKKLLLFAFVVLAIAGISAATAGFFLFSSSQNLIQEYRKIVLKSLPSTVLSTALRTAGKDVKTYIYKLGWEATPEKLQEAVDKLNELQATFDDSMREYKAIPMTDAEREIFKNVETTEAKWKDSVHKAIELRSVNHPSDLKPFLQYVDMDFKDATRDLISSLNDLVSFHQEQALLFRRNAEKEEASGLAKATGFVVVGLLLSVGVALVVGRRLSASLRGISNQMKDETITVASSSEQLSKVSLDLQNQTHLLSQTSQRASSAANEIATTVDRTLEVTENSVRATQICQQNVTEGLASVDSLKSGIESLAEENKRIVQQLGSGHQQIESLVGVIQEIGSKTRVIHDIVFQTRLLSFNASVEAARAGEQGKGFSVVAEEIVKLANLSGESAHQITTLLQDSQARVQEISKNSKISSEELISSNQNQFEQLKKRIENCLLSFQKIDQSSQELVQGMEHLGVANREQSLAIKDISKAMLELDKTTEQNANISKETHMTAEVLSEKVRRLNSSVQTMSKLVEGRKFNSFESLTQPSTPLRRSA